MDEQQIAGERLLRTAQPYLDAGDESGLVDRLEEEWSPECLALLLDHEDTKVVDVAARALGLIGKMPACAAVARLLHRDDPSVVKTAEDALWSIWFRAGGRAGRSVLARIAAAIQNRDMENVVPMLTELVRSQPTFAEAYHQRSLAYYFQNSFSAALRDARRAFLMNPWHFSALANQAHALVSLGRLKDALVSYRSVLQIHPHMPGVRLAVRHLRERLTPAGLSH